MMEQFISPQPKQKNFKTIPISNALRPVLARLKLRSKHDELIPYTGDKLTRIFAAYVARAELPADITFHVLRHTFATRLGSAGVSQSLIQTLLGQSDSDSTKIYVHAYTEDMVSAMNKISLPAANWLRLLIWLAIGLVIYFSYGRHHSVLGKVLRNEHGT